MQRLHGIHQLGLAHLVFPGANHTRLEHSLGTYHMASRLCTALELEEEDRQTVLAAAMLHDIGHTPYSHTLEEVICHRLGKDHANVSSDLIVGDYRPYEDRDIEVIGNIPPLPDLLEQNGVAPDKVADLVTTVNHSDPAQSTFAVEAGQAHFGQRNFLHQIISGPLDVDQMDYLLRDAHYTGVAHGTIDIDRLLHTMMIHHGDLVVQKGGLVAVEGLLVARSLMYTSVYFHKTVRIAEMMLCKAVEAAPPEALEDMFADSDCSFAAKLTDSGGTSARLVAKLKYRRLYKKALTLSISSLEEERADQLLDLVDYSRRKAKEREIADRAGVSEEEVILDIPEKALLLSEPRIGKTDVGILDGDRMKPLSRYSPLAKAIQSRSVHDWAVMVSTPAQNREVVKRAALKALFD